jgi:lipopolysaccharide transport system permease protein
VDRKWLSELWRYRELVYFLAWRDIKVRYKQAALGAVWAILQPLATMIVFTLVFGRLAGMSSGDNPNVPYPLFTYCALVLWTYCSVVIGQAGQCLVSNSNLITKVYFPRVALPASAAVSALLDLVIGLSFLIVLMVYYEVQPSWLLLLAPVFLVSLMLVTIGMSVLTAAVNVQYRDVKHAMPFLLQLWMFGTPVIYPLYIVPERYRFLMALNPLTGIVEGFRWCIFPGWQLDWPLTAVSLIMSVLVFVGGMVYFRRTERGFADVI